MPRLYQKIYLTIIASLVLVVLIAAAAWRFGSTFAPASQAFELVSELAAVALPPRTAPPAEQQASIERLAERLDIDLALFDEDLRPLAAAGSPLPRPSRRVERAGWVYGQGGPAWSLMLPDGRWIVARPPMRHRGPGLRILFFLAAIALAVALCSYPVVRGLTRRLERLQTGVETLGAGNLAARVEVQGRDEVARLATSFNRSAERIEELVGAHRMLLANASHELRTPLSRIRLGLELIGQSGDPRYKADLQRDIAELDALVDEILLASRLDANPALQADEDVDVLALAAEEGARCGTVVDVEGEPVVLKGDPRLLRRMIRNLLENAERHGVPPVRVLVRRIGAEALIAVSDAGPGVPEAEWERVFAPFYRLGADAKGTGLGLSLVRQIARLHGGRARVVRTTGDASRFEVLLPVDGGTTSRPA